MVSIQVLATPISGLHRSASVKPMALNIERAPARSRPSVIPRLRCLRSMVKDYNKLAPAEPRPHAAAKNYGGEPTLAEAMEKAYPSSSASSPSHLLRSLIAQDSQS